MSRSKRVTAHVSQGAVRLEGKRARSLRARPPGAAHEPLSGTKRPCRALKRSLFAEARKAASEQGVGDAREVARTALQLYRAAHRELGATGPSAIAALWSWALLAASAQTLTLAAARESLSSDRGLQLLERATKAQGRAERSWTAAAAACELLGTPKPAADPHAGLSVFGDPDEGSDEP